MNLKNIAITTAMLTTVTAFGQNLLVNGSFEADPGAGNTVFAGSPDSSTITGWTLNATSGSTAFVDFSAPGLNEPNPADGTQILNIGGFGTEKGVGFLWQDFATSIGQTYAVSYYFGRGNNDSVGSDTVSLNVSLYDVLLGSVSGSALASNDSGDAPLTGATSDLSFRTFDFTASGDTSRILVSDTSVSSGFSVYMDAFSVTSVPEPSSFALAGLGGLCLLILRRRKTVPSVATHLKA
jgi:hypothetical protein